MKKLLHVIQAIAAMVSLSDENILDAGSDEQRQGRVLFLSGECDRVSPVFAATNADHREGSGGSTSRWSEFV